MSEKTENPTPKKLRDARKDGQVAKSKEIPSAVLMSATLLFLIAQGPSYFERFEQFFDAFSKVYEFQDSASAVGYVFRLLKDIAFAIIIPFCLLVFVLGFASNYFQIGFLMSFKAAKPALNKISPATNAKNIFSIKNLMEFLKSIIKIVTLIVILTYVIAENIPSLLQAPRCGLDCVFSVTGAMLKEIVIYSIPVFVVIAGADFIFEKTQHIKKLKMSKDEVKREYKESEGDPMIKSQRKQLHQEMLMHDTSERVRKSSVLVTNPIHIAIGLYYDEEETPLPVIMAKGKDHIARRMVEIAKEEGIPVMQNIPLAHALNNECQMDQMIPSELIEPVAEVLRWVQSLENGEV